MISGSSTLRCRARWRIRIQPDAIAVTGSGKRRDQRSLRQPGGASTIRPLNSSFAAPVAGQIAYLTERLAANNNPNLLLLNYDLAQLSVVKSSGYALLDRTLLEGARRAQARVEVPAGLRGRRFRLEIPFVMNLVDE